MSKRVMMLPFFPQNPYQVLLRNGLAKCGIETVEEQMTWRLLRKAGANQVSAIHFHWLHPWTARTRPLRYWLERSNWIYQLKAIKRRGIRVVWTIHNLKDHENRSPKIDHDFCQLMADRCDQLICHSAQAAEEAAKHFRVDSEKISVIPHGNYIGWYPNTLSKPESRQRLGIPTDASVVLAFGEIRPYKNTIELVESFKVAGAANSFLIIAGRCKEPAYQERLEAVIGGDPRIKSYFRFIPDDEVQLYMNASDIAALPYRDILTSGAALLAMSFGLPLLAPRLRCFEEMPGDRGALLYSDRPGELLPAMKSAFSLQNLQTMREFNKALITSFGWERIAASTAAAYGCNIRADDSLPST